ncbi:MAG: 2-oxoacid:ferredoxin oxidoreductase subunit beta, partial [Actinomycetota bacterium]
TPIGIFRQVQRPVYEDQVQSQVDADIARRGEGDLASLLAGNETWTVSE